MADTLTNKANMAAELIEIKFTLNGESRVVKAHPMERLLDLLRERLNLTGTKEGCGEGECGACAVLLDGALVNSCLVPAMQLDGSEVITIEGAQALPQYAPMAKAFVEQNATQCGICTPGMILAGINLLREIPAPDEEQIRTWLAGNLCRCTGYTKIVEAVKIAAKSLGQGGTR